MVNWCPRCQTALSDLETIHEETQGDLWHIIYPVNGSDVKLVVATTRPETMLGDTAVAINPNDPRAAELAGQDGAVAADGSRDSDCARYDGRSEVRIGRREDHAGARSERFRSGQAAQSCRRSK